MFQFPQHAAASLQWLTVLISTLLFLLRNWLMAVTPVSHASHLQSFPQCSGGFGSVLIWEASTLSSQPPARVYFADLNSRFIKTCWKYSPLPPAACGSVGRKGRRFKSPPPHPPSLLLWLGEKTLKTLTPQLLPCRMAAHQLVCEWVNRRPLWSALGAQNSAWKAVRPVYHSGH